MPNFVYKIKKNEKIIKGKITAMDYETAENLLLKNSDEIIYIKKSFLSLNIEKKLSDKELISFFSSLASMDKVGVDILHSMEMMKDEASSTKKLKDICEKIYFEISTGTQFSEACQKTSSSFTHDYIGLIKIAEQTGNFAKIFEQIVAYIKWNYDIKVMAKKAIRGPLATLIFMIAIIILMSTLILPKVIEFIAYFGMETPTYTKILITFSSFIKTKWFLILAIFIIFYLSIKSLSNISEQFSINIDRLKTKIPLFGNLMIKIDTSRFITFFSLMYSNGADVLDIMTSVSEIVSNRFFGHRILLVRKKIQDGETIFKAINQEKTFPIMLRKMIAICETTGEVGGILENVKFFYDTEVKDTTEKVVGLIKPTTTIILGLMVTWMGSAMLGPIYANITSIGDLTSTSSSSY